MSSHIYHPDMHEHGLADGCPRCEEHAMRPAASMDEGNLATLRYRIANNWPARSMNESAAMDNLAKHDMIPPPNPH